MDRKLSSLALGLLLSCSAGALSGAEASVEAQRVGARQNFMSGSSAAMVLRLAGAGSTHIAARDRYRAGQATPADVALLTGIGIQGLQVPVPQGQNVPAPAPRQVVQQPVQQVQPPRQPAPQPVQQVQPPRQPAPAPAPQVPAPDPIPVPQPPQLVFNPVKAVVDALNIYGDTLTIYGATKDVAGLKLVFDLDGQEDEALYGHLAGIFTADEYFQPAHAPIARGVLQEVEN